jgi:hypothetical protein
LRAEDLTQPVKAYLFTHIELNEHKDRALQLFFAIWRCDIHQYCLKKPFGKLRSYIVLIVWHEYECDTYGPPSDSE